MYDPATGLLEVTMHVTFDKDTNWLSSDNPSVQVTNDFVDLINYHDGGDADYIEERFGMFSETSSGYGSSGGGFSGFSDTLVALSESKDASRSISSDEYDDDDVVDIYIDVVDESLWSL